MKKSRIVHGLSIVFGIWGGLALVGAWIAGTSGTVLRFSQQHLYDNAIVLTLIGISAGVCALIRLQLERQNQ